MPARRVKGPDQPLVVKEMDVKRVEDGIYNNLQYIHDMGDNETKWMVLTLANEILRQGVYHIACGDAPGGFRPIFDRIKPAVIVKR